MDDRKTGEQRDGDLDQRHVDPLGDEKNQRNEQNESDFEKQRDADDKGDEHHRPVHVVATEGPQQALGDPFGAAGLGHHLAQHGAETKHDADEADDAAEAILERLDDVGRGDAGDEAEKSGGESQRDKRMHPKPGDQHNQTDDRDEGIQKKKILVAHAEH